MRVNVLHNICPGIRPYQAAIQAEGAAVPFPLVIFLVHPQRSGVLADMMRESILGDLEGGSACGQAVRIKNHTAPDPGCPDYDPFYRSYLRMDDHLRRFYQTERQEKGSE